MKKAYFYETPLGKIGIAEDGCGFITNLFFGSTVKPENYSLEETPLLWEAGKQLREYFQKQRIEFQLPLKPEGTAFERSVWNALLEIPYGDTRSYGEIAKLLKNPKASRAVGRANGRNPISIFIPCHRVLGAKGTLTGYAGGLEAKRFLLELEQETLR